MELKNTMLHLIQRTVVKRGNRIHWWKWTRYESDLRWFSNCRPIPWFTTNFWLPIFFRMVNTDEWDTATRCCNYLLHLPMVSVDISNQQVFFSQETTYFLSSSSLLSCKMPWLCIRSSPFSSCFSEPGTRVSCVDTLLITILCNDLLNFSRHISSIILGFV